MPDSVDQNEHFLRLFMHHEPQLRAFVRACLPHSGDLDEIMQEVSIVAWRKFSTLVDVSQFAPWVCVIARYEILKVRRSRARDRLVLDEDLIERLAEEGAEEMPLRKRQLAALDDCIAKLPDQQRELALTAYSPETSLRSLARRLDCTEGSLYQSLARIRQKLAECVERTLRREVHPA